MKIYRRVKFDIETWRVLEEDSYEYRGPVALAKGGGGGGDTVDKDYNRRMAQIAEQQQAMAAEYFDFWRSDQKGLESAQIASSLELLPAQTQLQQSQIEAEQRMMPAREAEEAERLKYNKADLQARRPLAAKYYMEAMNGENETRAAAQAGAGVAQQYDMAKSGARRDAARAGVDVNSSRFAAGLTNIGLSRARDVAGQSTLARQQTRDANFGKLADAMNRPAGGA